MKILRKIYNWLVPGFIRTKIRERSPYYRRYQDLQKQFELSIAEYRSLLDDSHHQVQTKDQEIAKLIEANQVQTQHNQAKDQEIAKLIEANQIQTQHNQAKDQEIAKLIEANQAKDQEIARLKKVNQTPRESMRQVSLTSSSQENHFCGICGGQMQFSFSKRILNKYDVSYFSCPHCGHIQTEKPYWLKEAYNSPLSDSDTGQVWRNERNREIVCAVAQRFLPDAAKVLEYAAGYGLLTRMLRDAGMESFWYDKYAHNTFAHHFEDDGERKYDLALAFEALEHFEDPMTELENIFNRCDSLLFSEILLPEECPVNWWYLCTEHGQHVNFYSMKTLQYIADHFHKKLYFHKDIGMMTSLEIPPEDFAEMFDHVDELSKEFRASHQPLMVSDMNWVIQKMSQG